MDTALDLKRMKVPQLKALLKKRGFPVGGAKAELIERLRNPLTGPQPKAWQHSDAKKDLFKALLDPNSGVHGMSTEEVKNSDPRYKQYPYFAKYYKDLKKKAKDLKEQVKVDDLAARVHLMSFQKGLTNDKGYPYWDGHAAQRLLELDVAKGLHKTNPPRKLCQTREEYKCFPAKVFQKRVAGENSKQKAASFWAHKHNTRGMKRYLASSQDKL